MDNVPLYAMDADGAVDANIVLTIADGTVNEPAEAGALQTRDCAFELAGLTKSNTSENPEMSIRSLEPPPVHATVRLLARETVCPSKVEALVHRGIAGRLKLAVKAPTKLLPGPLRVPGPLFRNVGPLHPIE